MGCCERRRFGWPRARGWGRFAVALGYRSRADRRSIEPRGVLYTVGGQVRYRELAAAVQYGEAHRSLNYRPPAPEAILPLGFQQPTGGFNSNSKLVQTLGARHYKVRHGCCAAHGETPSLGFKAKKTPSPCYFRLSNSYMFSSVSKYKSLLLIGSPIPVSSLTTSCTWTAAARAAVAAGLPRTVSTPLSEPPVVA